MRYKHMISNAFSFLRKLKAAVELFRLRRVLHNLCGQLCAQRLCQPSNSLILKGKLRMPQIRATLSRNNQLGRRKIKWVGPAASRMFG